MRVKTVILLTICLSALIGCSSAKESTPEISAPPETVTLIETKVSNDIVEEDAAVKTEEMIETDHNVPYNVQEEAEAWTAEEYEYAKKVSADNHYSDWRIESLAHCYTYEDFEGMILQVYRMNIEFLSDMPESVVLVGGMSMTEDGWVIPDYPNSRYLIFQQDKDTLTFLTRMVENDCEPGDDIFTQDLEHQLAQK